jgi:hypothetical protein
MQATVGQRVVMRRKITVLLGIPSRGRFHNDFRVVAKTQREILAYNPKQPLKERSSSVLV